MRKVDLIHLPTPIEKISLDSRNNYYIKRDDMTGFCFGGNKARKMEFFLKDILDKGSDYLVTYGSSGSNHCRIVSAAAKRHNLPCLLIFSGEEREVKGEGNDLLNLLNESNFTFVGSGDVASTIDSVLEDLQEEGYNPYFIEGGGHGDPGTQAYKEAYDEIKRQSLDIGVDFDYIFLASGTGTTQAGLVAGKVLSSGKEEVVGISIARSKERGSSVIGESLDSYLCNWHKGAEYKKEDIIFLDDYTLGGYGKADSSVYSRIKWMLNKNAIAMDPTYTGKAFEGMCKYIKEKELTGKNILFIHTGGTPLFFSKSSEILNKSKR